ncbi:MAG TPA: M20/M25/M40 family metallo-hydrolase [Steroidobacteraceae bacterium]|jgi:acetylornithine deacetylase/succinyl-diaminopimelate desuccinylase-like protein|nr:M20/M25/M40 family metallo-hydrolase [Steroidobacteraceae bacterium]
MRHLFRRWSPLALGLAAPFAAAAPTITPADQASDALAIELFRELIEINTTDTPLGNVTPAAQAMARRLRDAGFAAADVQVVGPNDRKQNLVARLRGTGKHKPVLLIGHLDVVEAKREDWSTDPFKFVEKDGYYYGRGTQDMKDGDAIMTATLIRLKKEGYEPSRDIIMALTADEEGGTSNGVDWLFKNRRDLVDAQFVLNHDGSSIDTENGKPLVYKLESSEKVYADYVLTATNPGGHSSRPTPDNAIYELSEALTRIGKYDFPFELNNITRAYYENMSKIATGERAANMAGIVKMPPDQAAIARLRQDPADRSNTSTTCVATRLAGGHANNALPQRATANVNCRILPGHSLEEIRLDLVKVVNNPKITVQWISDEGQIMDKGSERKGFPPPPLRPEVMQPLQKLVGEFWPGLRVVPDMALGASDNVFVNAAGLSSYAVTGIAIDRENHRAHGQDERLGMKEFATGNQFYYRYLKALTAK